MEALTTNTTIKACFGFALVALLAVAIFVIAGGRPSLRALRWVDHTREVQQELNAALHAAVSAESASRGFLVTGDSTFIETFEPSLADALSHLQEIRRLTRDNPSQQARLD